MTRFLIVQHEDNVPADLFGRWWSAAGISLDTRFGWQDALPESLDGYDGFVVLGGAMNCYQDDAYPWLTPTKRLLARAVAGQTPTLGLCLGHQLLAAALGGEVTKMARINLGLVPIGRTAAGRSDELLSVVAEDAQAIQYNGDAVVRAPKGAVLLAQSPDGHTQAMRFGPRAWGLQFHPECSPATFDEWTVDKPADAQPVPPDGATPAEVSAAVHAAEESLHAWWRPCALRFATLAGHDA